MECHHGTRCPYLNGGDVSRLLRERDYLSQQLDEMEKVMGMAQAEMERLRQENQDLKEEKETLHYQLKQILGKIFKARIKADPEVNCPKRGAPHGHRATVADSRKRFRNLLISILINVITVVVRLRGRKEALMSRW